MLKLQKQVSLSVLPSPLSRSVLFQGLYHLCPNPQLTCIYSIYHVTDSQSGLRWKGPLKIISSKPPAMGRDIFH